MGRKKDNSSKPNSSQAETAYEYLLALIAEVGSGGVVIGGKTCHTLEEAEAAIAKLLQPPANGHSK